MAIQSALTPKLKINKKSYGKYFYYIMFSSLDTYLYMKTNTALSFQT